MEANLPKPQDAGVTMSDFLTDMLKEEQDMQNILAKGLIFTKIINI